MSDSVVPVVLFGYARPLHLTRVLACLRENSVPLILAYADGAKGAADAAGVAATRALLRSVDWAEVRLTERTENLGLGRNVMAGITEVAASHPAFIVWEDDLVCVPGTYTWLCAALRAYAHEPEVMSVTGWTHPRVTPPNIGTSPYFDGRAECWVWGSWARAWQGMAEENALTKMAAAEQRGVAPGSFGSDLPKMAIDEERRNIWAVRWLYHHLQHGGLCVRPPWTMVEHIGSDPAATNCADLGWMAQSCPVLAPLVPVGWPEIRLDPECARLWRDAVRVPGFARRCITWLVARRRAP